MVVDNPADVPAFSRHFKTESAHLLNNILGREKRTVWCEGYDSPIVLTPARTMVAIAYIYSNPAKDGMEDSIERYPGFSSWRMFQQGEHLKKWKWIRRPAVHALPKDSHNLRGYTKEAQRVLNQATIEHNFQIEPNAWMEAFGITDYGEQAKLNVAIVAHLRTLELRARAYRTLTGRRPLGRERMLQQKLDTYYRPKRTGMRMWCLAEKRSLRNAFIDFFRELMARARRISFKWRLGDFSESYPLGLYPPSLPKLAEPLGAW